MIGSLFPDQTRRRYVEIWRFDPCLIPCGEYFGTRTSGDEVT